ncbi:hypothetical protein HKBW3S43_01463 [Candidatus Hakubella thermalkaliphila]|uniref:Uncharacterized protein n=1 Tax=Candidatus Hakubella thermalkaliphila TaxID=2754717 RepID=A0A6V8PUV4_9ACTN|nr:hypothetical protein [Candidatus Hakubella thermalkaliphila]GFP35674.1 hypothetical protein HKBW3S43_01463 [Candidatus Hakubella thermalkaliphila]
MGRLIVDPKILRKGWKALVEELGVVDATKFVLAFEPGEGDSVKELQKMWGDKSIDEIHTEIMKLTKHRMKKFASQDVKASIH